MAKSCTLFAIDCLPNSIEWHFDNPQIEAWAEWFSHIPLLFSYLMGDLEHLPEKVASNTYVDTQSLSTLITPISQVKQRWNFLNLHFQQDIQNFPLDIAEKWQHIDQTIQTTHKTWLMLDCTLFNDATFGSKKFLKQLEQISELSKQFNLNNIFELKHSTANQIIQRPQFELGWWDRKCIARIWDIQADFEDFWWNEDFSKQWALTETRFFQDAIDAFTVHPKNKKLPSKKPTVDHAFSALVTPYGREILPLSLEIEMAFVQGGFIVASKAVKDLLHPSALYDLNGNEILPFSKGFNNIEVYSNALISHSILKEDGEIIQQLLHFPSLSLLQDNLKFIDYGRYEDGFIRAEGCDQKLNVYTPQGDLVFQLDHAILGKINAKHGLATLRQFKSDDQRENYGVINKHGEMIIPCEYQNIERGFQDSPPKIFKGGKIVAIDHDLQINIFNKKGTLLIHSDYYSLPYLHVQHDKILCFDGLNDEAQCGYFDIHSFVFIVTEEMTRADYFTALHDALLGRSTEAQFEIKINAWLEQVTASAWLHDISLLLCEQDQEQATELIHSTNAFIIEEFEISQEDVLVYCESQNIYTLYWQYLNVAAPKLYHFDYKDTESLYHLADFDEFTGWQWSRMDGDESMQDGMESLAHYLKPHHKSLLYINTDHDSICFAVLENIEVESFSALLQNALIHCYVIDA